MKIIKCLFISMALCVPLVSVNVFAYSDDDDHDCKEPTFRTFEPAHLSEVDPQSEISFHVANWADPSTITAEARKIPMDVKIEDKMNFFIGTAKLPESIKGKYARIHITALAKDGRCLGQDGWLLKVKKEAAPVETDIEESSEDSVENTAE
jgi:hypothetical protein